MTSPSVDGRTCHTFLIAQHGSSCKKILRLTVQLIQLQRNTPDVSSSVSLREYSTPVQLELADQIYCTLAANINILIHKHQWRPNLRGLSA